ncbi:MAG: NYN domain-containing protein [Aquificae bacterium]|nr:NYN domain-containing protein [Aquificota bacterium]
MKVGNFYLDNANLLNHLRQLFGRREQGGAVIDYGKLCLAVKEELEGYFNEPVRVLELYLYDGFVKNDEEKRLKKARFVFSVEKRLKEACPEVSFKPRLFEVYLGKGKRLKGDDVQLALDVCNDARDKGLNFVALFSGDGDFESLLEHLELRYPELVRVVVSFKTFCSKCLYDRAHYFIDLEELIKSVRFA